MKLVEFIWEGTIHQFVGLELALGGGSIRGRRGGKKKIYIYIYKIK